MSIETLAKQTQAGTHQGLASIETQKLRKLRSQQVKECFSRLDETAYRMQFVARIRGTEFVNDAASRNVNATWYALESNEGSLVWIANGDDSLADYSKLRSVAKEKVRMLVCVGNDNSQLHKAFDTVVPAVVDARSIGEAVHIAFYNNLDNTKVLYSPAGENGVPLDAEGQRFTMEVNEL
ncbi:MAG: hypothetical protein MJZ81_10240 [Bacteroidales bacterium]|nr:hypothetical protein [Bacteroidales bacterium]